MDQIGRAVQQFHADTLGITFSGAYQYKNIRQHLLELRELIPDDIDIWTGGGGVRRLRKLPRSLSENRLIYCGQAWLARFPDHFR
jgi:hypothetical protein